MAPKRTPVQETAITCSGSLCVTAGAGTGKTYVLVSRYLDLLEREGGDRATVQEILALTFTEKAAAEMKDRVRQALDTATGEDAARFRDDLMWAGISTIHSFCARVLKEYALEAGLEPGFAVIEDHELAEMADEALYRLFCGSLPEDVREATLTCLRVFGSWQLTDALGLLYDQRWNAEQFFATVRDTPEEVITAWTKVLTEEHNEICREFFASPAGEAAGVLSELALTHAGDGDAGTKYLASVSPFLEALNPERPKESCRALDELFACKGRRGMGSAKFFSPDMKRQLNIAYNTLMEFQETISPGLLSLTISSEVSSTQETIRVLQALGTVFSFYADAIGRMKAQRGGIDFGDMLILTRQLLAENPSAKQSIAAKYRVLMVDEFQDTDPLQAAIIADILTAGEKKRDLFVVGDPKQSIYLFRNADVTQFKATRDQITTKRGGREVALDTSFRSAPEIISLVNTLFATILGADKKPWEFGYDPIGVTDSREGHTGSVEVLITPDAKKSSERHLAEAEAVAAWISETVAARTKTVYERGDDGEWVNRPAEFRDCAVLLETRTHLALVEDAFRRAGVPYHVHGGTAFYERQEVRDCASVIAFLADPEDDIALYGALRSPFFGLSDAEICTAANGRGRRLFSRLKHHPNGPAADACRTLKRWQSYARRELPSELVSRILHESGMYAVCAGLRDGGQQTANLRKVTELARSRETAGCYGFDDFAQDFVQSVRDAPKEEDAAESDTGDDAVTVMTVHASKGLEFPVVVLPFTNDKSSGKANSVVFEEGLGPSVKIMGDKGPEEAPVSGLIKHLRKQKDAAEARRLFYVAVTRARDHILLSGTMPDMDLVALGPETGTTRMHRTLAALGITTDDLLAGGKYNITPEGREWHVMVTTKDAGEVILTANGAPDPVQLTGPLPKTAQSAAWMAEPSPCTVASSAPLPVTAIPRYASGKGKPEESSASLLQSGVSKDIEQRKGDLVHAVFAGMSPKRACERFGFSADPEQMATLKEAYATFLSHPLIRESSQHQCEIPFVHRFHGVLVRGVIDRIVRTAEGRHAIIDYKSGPDPGKGTWRTEYDIQLAVYAEAVRALTGEMPETYLYYTRTGRAEPVIPDIAAAKKAAEAAEAHRCDGIMP